MTRGPKLTVFGAPKREARPLPTKVGVSTPAFSGILPEERNTMVFLAVVIAVAWSVPHPVTKKVMMGVLGIYTTRIFFTNFNLAVCLLPVLIPAQNLIPPGLFPIPGLNYETMLMALLLVAHQVHRAKQPPRRPAHPMPLFVPVLLALLGWIAVTALPTLFSGAGFTAWDLFSTYKNQFVYVVILFVVGDALREDRDRLRMMVAVTIAIILVSLQPLYKGTELLAAGMSLERHRAVSILALQPNIYGGALACFAAFPIVYFARRIGGPRARLLFAVGGGVAVYCLVLTLSRGSWLGFAGSAVVIGLLVERRVLLILAIGAITSPWWVPQDAVNRADTLSTISVTDGSMADDEASGFVRIDQWKIIPKALAASPVLGHGYQVFPWVYQEYGSLGIYKGAHVGYAEYATETGLPGLFLYCALFVTLGWFGWQVASRGIGVVARAQGVGLMGAAVAMIIAECFGSRFKVGTVTAFLWMYAGVALAAWRFPVSADEDVEPAPAGRGRGGLIPEARFRNRARRVARPS